MKKVLLSITAFSLILGCAVLSAPAVAEAVERGFVSVSTSANTEIVPDIADISIAVQTYDSKSLQKATEENKEISEKVLSALRVMINPLQGDYVKTMDFSASPLYTYSGSKRNFDKYQVSNTVVIHTKAVNKVGSMIDKAICLGATNVNNLAFSVSNYDDECNELLVTATKKAQNRANLLAKSASTSVTGVRSLNVSCSANNSITPQYRMLAANIGGADMAEAKASSTSIEKGIVKIYATVNATFFVK